MKKQPFVNYVFRCLTYFLILGVFIILFASCDDDDGPGVNDNNVSLGTEQSEAVVRDYININANLQAARNMGSGIIPFEDGNGPNGRTLREGLTNLENARTFTDSLWFESCAEIDISIRGAGISITIDYGEEGCEESGNLLKGKITETFTLSGDSLVQESIYDNFSFNDVTLNGSRTASFALTSLDSESFVVSWAEDLEVSWEDGRSYTLVTDMSSSFDGEEIVITGFTDLSASDGDRYRVTIDEALVYTLACIKEGIYAPVEGIETLVVNNDSISNDSIVINYGNGDCDYLVEITQSGETTVIDISDEYEDLAFAFGFIFGGHGDDGHDHDKGDCIKLSDNIVSETRELSAFENIIVKDIARVFLEQGQEQSVRVEAADNLLPEVLTDVEDNTLIIALEDNTCIKGYNDNDVFVDVYITIPEITTLSVKGVGAIVGEEIQGDSLSMGISGAGKIDLDVAYESVYVGVSGAGEVSLSGLVTDQVVSINGAGSYSAFELISANCEIDINGAGVGEVTVNEKLNVTIKGAGAVYYKGEPEITSDVGLIGKLINAN